MQCVEKTCGPPNGKQFFFYCDRRRDGYGSRGRGIYDTKYACERRFCPPRAPQISRSKSVKRTLEQSGSFWGGTRRSIWPPPKFQNNSVRFSIVCSSRKSFWEKTTHNFSMLRSLPKMYDPSLRISLARTFASKHNEQKYVV